jgi:hypothetical protein
MFAGLPTGWNFWEWQGHRVHYITAGTQVSTAQPSMIVYCYKCTRAAKYNSQHLHQSKCYNSQHVLHRLALHLSSAWTEACTVLIAAAG